MFSLRTRGHILTGLTVVIYGAMCFFVPLVLVPLLRRNAEDKTALRDGRKGMDRWLADPAVQLPVKARLAAAASHAQQVIEAHKEFRWFYKDTEGGKRDRDALLERHTLFRTDPDNPFWLKEDYDALMAEWSRDASHFGLDATARLAVAPMYPWAGAEGVGTPAKEDYDAVIKRACVTDTVLRLMCNTGSPLARCALRSVKHVSHQPAPDGPTKSNVREFGALRYSIWQLEVEFQARFDLLRGVLERIVTAPAQRVTAPQTVNPPQRESYFFPLVRLRKIAFRPEQKDWATVTMVLEICDFEAPPAPAEK